MVEVELKKIAAPDFTLSIRPGTSALVVVNEEAIPGDYWEPRDPRLNRVDLLTDLKRGVSVPGVQLSNPEPVLSVRVRMGFSDTQLRALNRNVPSRSIKSRISNGKELHYIEGWYVLTQANRIFGFEGWDRETLDAQSLVSRESRGQHVAAYAVRVRITVRAGERTVLRDGRGTGEAWGSSVGEAAR